MSGHRTEILDELVKKTIPLFLLHRNPRNERGVRGFPVGETVYCNAFILIILQWLKVIFLSSIAYLPLEFITSYSVKNSAE